MVLNMFALTICLFLLQFLHTKTQQKNLTIIFQGQLIIYDILSARLSEIVQLRVSFTGTIKGNCACNFVLYKICKKQNL